MKVTGHYRQTDRERGLPKHFWRRNTTKENVRRNQPVGSCGLRFCDLTWPDLTYPSMMILRQSQAKLVLLVILGCFCCSCFTIFYILTHHSNLKCNCPESPESLNNSPQLSASKAGDVVTEGSHKLCILVPFRDRFEELLEFAPYISSFLNNQNVNHEIYILNQADKLR